MVKYGLQLTSGGGDPVTTAEVKSHARIEISDDDTWIAAKITAATNWVQAFLGRQLVDATYEWTLPNWPLKTYVFEVPRPPLQSVTSVEYIADTTTDHTYTTWTASGNYYVDTASEPGRIRKEVDASFPTLADSELAPIKVTFVARYGSAGNIPEQIKLGIEALTHYWYERPETMAQSMNLLGRGQVNSREVNLPPVPAYIKSILMPHKVHFAEITNAY